MDYQLKTSFFDNVINFIATISTKDSKKVAATMDMMRNSKFESVVIKQLKGDIKELKVKRYRFIFFIIQNTIYFVRAFIKKSNKTPKNEIELVEKIYKLFITTKK